MNSQIFRVLIVSVCISATAIVLGTALFQPQVLWVGLNAFYSLGLWSLMSALVLMFAGLLMLCQSRPLEWIVGRDPNYTRQEVYGLFLSWVASVPVGLWLLLNFSILTPATSGLISVAFCALIAGSLVWTVGFIAACGLTILTSIIQFATRPRVPSR